MDLVKQSQTIGADNLIAGIEIPFLTRGVEMLSGQGVVKRGSILTKDANGKYFLIATNSQTAEGVLAEDIDTNLNSVGIMYRQGHFNKEALLFGTSITKISELGRTLREINVVISNVH